MFKLIKYDSKSKRIVLLDTCFPPQYEKLGKQHIYAQFIFFTIKIYQARNLNVSKNLYLCLKYCMDMYHLDYLDMLNFIDYNWKLCKPKLDFKYFVLIKRVLLPQLRKPQK